MTLLHILVFASAIVTACCASTLPAERDFSDRTVGQVLELLESGDRSVRADAAFSLGFRYHHGLSVNPPTWKKQHPEFPLPAQLLPRLNKHLKSDPDDVVRIVTLRALSDLRFWTNTTPILLTGLRDKAESVRIETCKLLIDVSHQYSEPLSEAVLYTLQQGLQSDINTEGPWYAAWIAGQLGADGKPLVPALRELTKHNSSKVRDYARKALSSIQQKTTEKE